MKKNTALLLLENGGCFYGYGAGAEGVVAGELCFVTSYTGYQEIITDPSYARQIVIFAFPYIGNVGVNKEDMEFSRVVLSGVVVREPIPSYSSYRAEEGLSEWLQSVGVPVLYGIDTRALIRYVRKEGPLRAVLAFDRKGVVEEDYRCYFEKALPLDGYDLSKEVSCSEPYEWMGGGLLHHKDVAMTRTIAVIDYGCKQEIFRNLVSRGCRVLVFPSGTSVAEVLACKPNGIILSPGPGDPASMVSDIVLVRALMDSGIPIFGICLGHQLLALASGMKTVKMSVGHRGVNHPVKTMSGGLRITVQNHGFAVLADDLPEGVQVMRTSLFDGSVEGLVWNNRPIFSTQSHPEASPGPWDDRDLFDEFIKLTDGFHTSK